MGFLPNTAPLFQPRRRKLVKAIFGIGGGLLRVGLPASLGPDTGPCGIPPVPVWVRWGQELTYMVLFVKVGWPFIA